MCVYRKRILILLLGHICISLSNADVCESCKRIDDCNIYGEMTKEQQQQWIQKFPCKALENSGTSAIPGFSTVAKGDYICCPSFPIWGLSEDNSTSAPTNEDKDTQSDHHYVPNYLFYDQNQHNRDTYDLPYVNKQPWFLNNAQNGFNNGGYDNDFGQCTPQNTPPNPESGCCGVDMSDSDRITDLEQFLQYNTPFSNRGPQSNYLRYSKESSSDFDDVLDITFEYRIAGGRATDLDQYPWTAFLGIQFVNGYEQTYFVCGGSLISSRFVLTAAHCMLNENGELDWIDVTLAEYDKRTFPRDCVNVGEGKPICIENLRVPAENVIIHPNYIEEFLINDIALIRLRETVPYTRYIRPICLPPINIDSAQFSNLPLATAGWGLNVSTESDVKQFTILHMVPKSECAAHYPHLTDGHLCASGQRTEDTCKGDSGGPLMMVYKGKYYVVGIVSGKTAAFRCGTPVPSLYTNVYAYLDWIRNYVR